MIATGRRAVLDAGVLVSALLRPDAPAGQLLRRRVEERSFELILTDEILEEVDRTLRLPQVRRHLAEPASSRFRERFSTSLGLVATLVDVEGVGGGTVAGDSDDDKYLRAVKAARAKFLVTSDPHLLTHQARVVEILRPRAFLELLDLDVVAVGEETLASV